MATTMVMANSRKMRPTSPEHEYQRKEHGRERDRHRKYGEADFLALLRVAWSGGSPFSMRRTVFSRNTMASSTRKPIARVKSHQREVVEAVPQQTHGHESKQERHR